MKKNYYVYDIFLDDKIIEYNGDIWHANPKIYKEDFVNPVTKMTYEQIHKKEFHKESIANDHGYILYRVWETDYKNNKERVIEECINFLKQ